MEVYSEIYRVLKQGGIFGVFEWVLTDTFSTDSGQIAIRLGIERGNGVPAIQRKTVAREAMQKVGFELIITEDLAERSGSFTMVVSHFW